MNPNPNPNMPKTNTPEWAIVEVMGHTTLAGQATEVTKFGSPFIRVDIPEAEKRKAFTTFISPQALYRYTPVDEEYARAAASRLDIKPPQVYTVEAEFRAVRGRVAELEQQLKMATERGLPAGEPSPASEPIQPDQIESDDDEHPCPSCGSSMELVNTLNGCVRCFTTAAEWACTGCGEEYCDGCAEEERNIGASEDCDDGDEEDEDPACETCAYRESGSCQITTRKTCDDWERKFGDSKERDDESEGNK